jgi:tetratricopeptide (TPR) repeat protein/transglutaminase-like putative cysteine protease
MLSYKFRVPVFGLCLQIPLFLASVFAGPLVAHAQEPSWSLVGPAFSASVEEIQKAAAAVPAEKYMEATVLFERDAYTLDMQGRVTYRHSMVYRIETQSGIEGWSETDARWEPWYQNEPEIRARVIGADGKVSPLDPKTVTDGPANEDDEDTYTDARERKAPLPGLAVGAIVEEETTTTDKLPFFAGGGIYRDSFLRSVPIIHSELLIDVGKEFNLQYRVHLMPAVKISDESQDGVRHLRFVQEYLSAHDNSDIDLATHNFTGPLIEFSTGTSWASVASAYRELSEAHIDPEKVKTLLPAVPAGADRVATVQLLVARLHKDIRYTGIEFGEASLQPATATEIIKRHYGDCKDKAALLVAMLRASGIPASLALLDTGPGIDVTPELPGMNEFDHAIVYVPAAGGGDPLWIDATAEYGQVGTLPSMDEGRLALIIAEGTTALTLTPTPKPEDDLLTELRDVTMAGYGSAHISETSLTHGEIDASYREDFGGAETREKKVNMEKYAKDEYLAKALASVDHGDGRDLTKPFVLKLDMKEAKRGNTMMDDAAVAIPFSEIFGRLPEWFKTDPKVEGEKQTPQQEENRRRAVQARTSEYDVHPFATEWRYTITPPAGFVLRALPDDKSTDMGPAKLTQHYEADSAGVIKAVFHFDTGKPHYTVDEALALRDAVLAAYKQDMILVLFDQAGAKLLAAGKTREALAADRALIEQHPMEALHHAQIGYAFLHAGLGDKARQEAHQAVKLDPKSAVGYKALGWICQFNEIGVQRARGFDWDCAASAYKKALEIDPDDSDTAVNLAVLDEFDRDGERYSANAHLTDAIRSYRELKQKDKSVGDQYDDNILFDLLYSGQYKELLDEVAKLPSSVTRQALAISATVAMQGGAKGIAAGIDRADHLAAGAEDRTSALASAGTQLLHLRMYPEAAGILSAGVEGQSNSAAVAQQIAVFRDLKPWKDEYLPASDPRAVVQRMFMTVVTAGFNEKIAAEVLTRHAYGSDEEWRRNLEKVTENNGMLHAFAAQSGLPASVLLDVIAGNLKLTVEGDDETGHRISMQSLGSNTQRFFVTKEDGAYKIVTDGTTLSESGNEVLYLLHAGREREARSLLDWTRDRMHKGGGDDPLSGPLLPRFWSVGDQGDAAAMQLAAASLVASNDGVKELLPGLRAGWEKAASDDARLNLGLLLATGYMHAEDGEDLKTVSAEILKKYPDSYVAINFAGSADGLLKDWKDSSELIESRLAKHPDDENLLRIKILFAEEKGDFALARATEQTLIDKGKGTAGDYNNVAWLALFDDKVDAGSVKSAQQATMLTKDSTFAELHTLACIYAHEGKSAEARDMLLKAMTVENLTEPNAAVWYGFGSIYEQYGVNDAAIAAYKKVERPAGRIGVTSTYSLAQARLKALGAAANQASAR